MRRLLRALALSCSASVAIATAACGAGSNPPPNRALGAALSSVQFKIVIPVANTSMSYRSPAYISVATQSVAITVSGGAPVIANLTSGSPNCAGTPLTCTLSVAAPVGTDVFAVTFYDAQNGTGNELSTGTVAATIVAGQANVVSITYNGIIRSLSLTLAQSAPPANGSSQQITLTLNALDADGNVIISPGTYADGPISVTDSDTSHTQLQLGSNAPASSISVGGPGQGISVLYDGSSALVSAVFTASVTSSSTIPAQHVTMTPRAPGAIPLPFGIYVSDLGANELLRFSPGSSGSVSPLTTTALTGASAVAVDAAYTVLSIPAASPPYVQAYDASFNTLGTIAGPSFQVVPNKTYPIATDGDGYVYVAVHGSTPEVEQYMPFFSQYTPGTHASPLQVIQSGGAVAADANGNVYVLLGGSTAGPDPTVDVYSAISPGGPLTLSRSFTIAIVHDPYGSIDGIAADNLGNVYVTVADSTGVNTPGVYVFGPHATGSSLSPSTILSNANLRTPSAVAVDQRGNVYVVNGLDPSYQTTPTLLIDVFSSNGSLTRTITSSAFSNPNGIAVGPAIVASPSRVSLCNNPYGGCGPTATITAADPGYTGTLSAAVVASASGYCPAAFSVSPASQQVTSPSGSTTFTVTEIIGANCAVKITDSTGGEALIYATGN